MFPEMHLTVNEVEKMAVGEKIKFWQILELERGGKKKKKSSSHLGRECWASTPRRESVIAGYPTLIRAAKSNPCLALCLQPKTIQKSGNLDKVLVKAGAAGIRG